LGEDKCKGWMFGSGVVANLCECTTFFFFFFLSFRMKNKTSSLTFVFVGEGIVWEKMNVKVGCLVVGWLLTYVSVYYFF
jgi:hypothetical protein